MKTGLIIVIFFNLFQISGWTQSLVGEYSSFIEVNTFEVQVYPVNDDDIFGINISNSQTTSVPINGGVYITGLDFWLEEPASGYLALRHTGQNEFLSLETDGSQVFLFRTAEGNSELVKEKLASIESGIYQFKLYDSRIFIYGFTAEQGVIYLYENGDLSTLYRSKRAVKDIAISDETIALCEGNQITFLDQSGNITSVFQTDLRINGVAFGNDNTIFLATELGVLQYYSFDGGDYEIITKLINGPLDFIDNTLYLLFKPDFKVIKIQLG